MFPYECYIIMQMQNPEGFELGTSKVYLLVAWSLVGEIHC